MQNISNQFNIIYDNDYLIARWRKIFKTKTYKGIDNLAVREILLRDNSTCQYCNKRNNLHIHHVIPQHRKYRGPNSYYNLVTACQKCNSEILNRIVLPRNWWKLHPDSKNFYS